VRYVFLNLPVTDLERAKAFYAALGFANNAQFTDDTAAAMVIEENIVAMLLTREKFASFVPGGRVGDPTEAPTVLLALSAGSRAECDDLLEKALAAGGKPWQPAQDHGFMYGTSFADPDGNGWEVTWMDPAVVQG
jgi:predicted lactoylglutathione lyase